MPIKMHGGKEYFTVVERMDMLLEEQGKANYSLETNVTYESGIVIVKATLTLYDGGIERTYSGHALGELGKAKTLEATETHAIGRALSTAGWFGSEFASANEMESYEKQKKAIKPKPIPKDVNPIEDDISEYDPNVVNGSSSDSGKLITFGKNKGKKWSEVDDGWLKWIVENNEKYKDDANAELVFRGTSKVSSGI